MSLVLDFHPKMNCSKMDLHDLFNFLLDNWIDPHSKKSMRLLEGISMKKYSSYRNSKYVSSGQLSNLMNGVIREKLKIIPKNVR